jgi:hypothetical protein
MKFKITKSVLKVNFISIQKIQSIDSKYDVTFLTFSLPN